MVLAEVFTSRDEEAGGAAGRIADHVLGYRRGELDHQLNDVPWSPKLTVLAGGRDLGEQVLIDVALGVAILHGDLVEEVDHLGEQARRGDREPRILHVVRVGGAVPPEGAEEGEDVLGHHGEHVGGGEVAEAGPAQVVVGALLRVGALGEDAALHGLLEPEGLVELEGVEVVEAAEEEQVGDLLDDLERVGDAAGPEGGPDAVDLAAELAGEHAGSWWVRRWGGGAAGRSRWGRISRRAASGRQGGSAARGRGAGESLRVSKEARGRDAAGHGRRVRRFLSSFLSSHPGATRHAPGSSPRKPRGSRAPRPRARRLQSALAP